MYATVSPSIGVERDGPLRGIPEGAVLPAKEMGLRQMAVGEVVGGRGGDSAPGGLECATERIGPGIEPVHVLIRIHPREHGPAVGTVRRPLDGPLQDVPDLCVVFRGHPREESERAQHRLIRAQRIRVAVAKRLAHGVGQHPVPVGSG